MIKLNQILYVLYPLYVDCRTEEIFAIACPWKKLGFHTKIPNILNNYFELLV